MSRTSKEAAPPTQGRVLLVGAGPGEPDLLTVRAARALAEADVVLYDALVDTRMLDLAPRAQRFCVGKRAGAASVAQETIHTLMIRSARAGRRVVRLKAGDPFVLGRGGEEVLALGAAGVAVEVVPGISTATAGPEAVGIPVTHRHVASAFLVVSAVPEKAFLRVVSSLTPDGVTLVVLMGIGARRDIVRALAEAEWPTEHPAAIVLGAHTPRVWSWTGTLDQLGEVALPEDRADLPGVVVIGETVAVGREVRLALEGKSEELTGGASRCAHKEKQRDYA